MSEYDKVALERYFGFIKRRLGYNCQFKIERRTDRWSVAVEWVSERDSEIHMAGVLSHAGDPTPDQAMEVLATKIAVLEQHGLV